MTRAGRLAATLLLAGCGAAPTPPPPEPLAPPPASAAPVPAGPPILMLAAPPAVFDPAPRAPFATPGTVAGKGETLASWVEPAYEGDHASPYVHVVAAGLSAALIRRGGALHAAHLDRGVTGALAVPAGVFWVGLDGEDAMFAARPDGTLFRAGDLGRAIDASGFTPIATIPDAIAWDATEHLLVAAGGHWAFASSNGGRSFRWAALPEGFVAAQIAARPDGVVVVLGHEGGDARRPQTLVSRDRGASFHPSEFQPVYLWREGARIHGEQGKCAAALSTDGASWSLSPAHEGYQERHRWERMLSPSDTRGPRPRERVITLRDPAAPSPPRAGMRVGPGCPPEEERSKGGGIFGGFAGTAIGVGGIGGLGREDKGVLGLAGTGPRWPAEARTTWAILDDSTSRLARFDRREGSLATMDAPEGCTPDRPLSARGTAALLCAPAGGARAVYLAGRDGRWYGEGAIRCDSDEVRLLGAEPDGTFAIRCGRMYDASFALWVRRPAPLGTPDAIRKVQIPGALTYRLLSGGRAVAVTTRGKAEHGGIGLGFGKRRGAKQPASSPAAARERHTFSVMLDEPSGVSAIARDLYVAEDVEALATRADALYFRLEGQGHAIRFTKLEKGRLQAAPPAEVPAEIRPEPPQLPPASMSLAISIPAPGAIAADATHVYFSDTGAGRVLRVPKRGGAPEVLASGLAGPLAVAVDDARVYVTTIGEAYGKGGSVIMLPKSGGAATMLAEGLVRPIAVAADEGAVYWLEQGLDDGANGVLFRIDKSGGPARKVLDRLASPRSLAVDAARIYVGQGNGEVLAVPRTGGPAQRIGARGDGVPALAAVNGSALWIAGHEGIVAGGTGEIVGRARFEPDAFAVRGDELFLLNQAGGRLARGRSGQDRSEVIAEGLVAPTSIIADEAGLFVREHDGRRVQRFGREGGRGAVIYERR